MKITSVVSALLQSRAQLRELKKLLPAIQQAKSDPKRILVQVVADPYYSTLFISALNGMARYNRVVVDLLVFRSIESGMGNGLVASLKRTFPYTWLVTRPWIQIFGGFAPTIGYRSVSWQHPIEDLVLYFRAGNIWRHFQNIKDLEQLPVEGIQIGDLIIDTYLRFRPAATVDIRDPFLRYLLWQALRDVYRANRYFKRRRPDIFLSSYSTYIQHGIAVRVALVHNTRVVTFGNYQQIGKVLSTDDVFHTKNPTNYRQDFKVRCDREQVLQLARSQLEMRLSGGIDSATFYMNSSAFADSEEACPDVKGAVIVYLHDFFDSPHVYAELVFPDFWTWVCFTIEKLQAFGIPFFLKRHPNEVAASSSVIADLQRIYPSVRFLPDGVTTLQLVTGGIACVITVYGTIAHEAAYLGVSSIACARHPHIAFDFCNTARTLIEYETLLRQAGDLSIQDIEMARGQVLEFYAMHNLDYEPDQLSTRERLVDLRRICFSKEFNVQHVADAAKALLNDSGFISFSSGLLKNLPRCF